jgi:hypothetical protein
MNLMITYKDTTYNDMAAMKTYKSYEQNSMFSPRQKCVTTVYDNTGRTTSNYLFITKGGFLKEIVIIVLILYMYCTLYGPCLNTVVFIHDKDA